MDEAQLSYQLLWPEDGAPAGPLNTYPIGFASVHWPLVPNARYEFSLRPYRGEIVALALDELGVAAEAPIVVDPCRGGEPRILLAAKDFLQVPEPLIGSEAWLYGLQETWLIEVYHEGTITFASGPGPIELAGDAWRLFGRGTPTLP